MLGTLVCISSGHQYSEKAVVANYELSEFSNQSWMQLEFPERLLDDYFCQFYFALPDDE